MTKKLGETGLQRSHGKYDDGDRMLLTIVSCLMAAGSVGGVVYLIGHHIGWWNLVYIGIILSVALTVLCWIFWDLLVMSFRHLIHPEEFEGAEWELQPTGTKTPTRDDL